MRSELWELARRLYIPRQAVYNTTRQLMSGPRVNRPGLGLRIVTVRCAGNTAANGGPG